MVKIYSVQYFTFIKIVNTDEFVNKGTGKIFADIAVISYFIDFVLNVGMKREIKKDL